MQLSVAVTAFNAAEYLREAIASVFAQTLRPIDIVVVDDGSTDSTRQVCQSFGPKVTYIYHENDGTIGATARALAIAKAKSDWVALLDQDDLWMPNKLEKQVAVAEKSPDVGAIFTRYQSIDSNGDPLEVTAEERPTGKILHLSSREAFHFLLKRNPYCPSSVLINRKVFTRCGYPDVYDPGCGDWDTWLRIARHFPIAVVDEYLTRYRVHAGQSCVSKHWLASGLKLTLARQKAQLHPNCGECRRAYRAGEEHVAGVFTVAARTYLDQYFAAARGGELANAWPFLRGALKTSPWEVLKPRRFVAVTRNLAIGAMRRARHLRVQP
jgi:glycosyltransferase involved in cell wall biosynthesis